jgi:hypothetical protein
MHLSFFLKRAKTNINIFILRLTVDSWSQKAKLQIKGSITSRMTVELIDFPRITFKIEYHPHKALEQV